MSRPLFLVSVTAFLYLLGLGVLFPVLPYFGRDLGLSELQLGTLMGVYALASVLTAPFWGRFSDRYGRRPAMLIGLSGFALAFGLFALGTTFAQLFAARVLGGVLAAATQPAILSYAVDVTPPERRSTALGIVGAAFGLGVVSGPILGGLIGGYDYRLPFFVTAGIGATAAVAVAVWLPESLTPAIREEAQRRRRLLTERGFGIAHIAAGLAPFLSYSLLVQAGRSGLESTLGFLVADRLAGSVTDVGYLLGAAGVVAVIVQGGLIRPLVQRAGDHPVMLAGTVLQGLGLLGLAFESGWGGMASATILIGFGSALLMPTFTAELSRAAEDVQGEAQGLNASVQSLGRAVGPVVFTLLYQTSGTILPYVVAAACCALAAGIASRGLRSSLAG